MPRNARHFFCEKLKLEKFWRRYTHLELAVPLVANVFDIELTDYFDINEHECIR